ncbi:MAG: DNA phosphorothioation-dependent restriction protein DptG, partial [Erysipelotrichaceae bacterium]|nr:DNA phosphorothioation-dependent restriction protein DptG [Erysipelotrichaceae bacterium]
MTYRADIEKFKESNIWKSNNSIENNTGYSVGLFPFRTGSNQVYDMENAIKGFLTEVDQKELKLLNPEQLIHQIEQEPDLVSGIEKEETRKLFEQIIKVMFYQGDELRVKNLRTMMSNAKSSKDDKKVSRFLRDVLGDQKILKAAMDQKLEEDESSANTFEKLVFKKMDLEDLTSDEKKSGFIQVLNWLAPSFEKDFKFIVSDTGRTKDYLVQMVEFYCFTYMSYLILTLNDFLHGSREQSRQLFYALEWEKTTQSRDCYHLGWKQIDNYLDTLFPHAIVFELLNFRDGEEENVDYIKLF